jgi:CheY-like chemotaxis protein
MAESIEILVVDDRPENLLAMEALLEQPGVRVVTAASGPETLSLMLEHDFALILLDVQMPGMDGFETAELIRGSDRTRHVPIIFVTAISKDQAHVFKGYDAGAVDYLKKPIEPAILLSKVKVFCEMSRKERLIRTQLAEIEEKNKQLEKQLQEIKTLRGFIPICSACKKIRNDEGYWEAIEVYIRDHSAAEFSHGLCPDCIETLYKKYDK